ncbi:hypothetical protein [Bacillus subtilis]|uniref:hypothetical protein n=1 Tax=Bacillus subtilis TaxID=1423 RepID=UPI0003A88A89|nr:hypothetical protein [Bacillus subtilis]MEC1004878.1 hypothetical protein [Bacillus subtilis]MEC1075036.1 hypothetical protein [Bacillus subtilis]NLS41516.1 hypothetical protein [Bacillus subtilis]
METYNVEDVFVSVGFPEHTYISREKIEREMKLGKVNRSKQILVYGGSKMGKSNLWRKHFSEDEIIKIPINSNKTVDDIYTEILSELQAFYTTEKGQSTGVTASLIGELQAKVAALFNAKLQASTQTTRTKSDKEVAVVTPLIGANLVIKYLKPSRKVIVLEDFHYANESVKKQISQDLKAFSDERQQFVMLSVEQNNTDLVLYNTDLMGRIIGISVGSFSYHELHEMVTRGANLLNIEFSEQMTDKIVDESMYSAALAQDICLRLCFELDIMRTCTERQYFDDLGLVERACESIASDNEIAYKKIVAEVAAGGRSDGTTEKYKWFLRMIRDTDIPEEGLRNTEVLQRLRAMGHTNIEQNSVTSGLKYLPNLLVRRNLPPVFGFNGGDGAERFYLLDKYMKFVFKWQPDLIDSLFS